MTKSQKTSWLIPTKPDNLTWPRWIGARLIRMAILFLILFIGGGLIFKNHLIFYGEEKYESEPQAYGLVYEEIWLTLADGSEVKAWKISPPPERDRQAALIFFQGNAGNMSYMLGRISVFANLGLTVLAADYPGYGESQGSPDEDNVYQTAQSLWQYAESQGFNSKNIVIYGFSLGGGVASYLAENHSPAALVLDSTFTKLRDVPSTQMPWFEPYFHLVLGEAFDTKDRLANIHSPLLILHSQDDSVVPYELGQELFESYQNNYKDMATGTGDHMSFLQNQDIYGERLEKLLTAAGLGPKAD